MPAGEADIPVVVTFREIERILGRSEAVSTIEEVARQDSAASDIEKAAAMAAVGYTLNELRKAEQRADALVLTTVHHGPASRLQSLVASGQAGRLKLTPLATGGFEAKFHLGDIYYSGTEQEVEQRFLGMWPAPPNAIRRALNSNHEMYSGGEAYFGKILPEFKQESSYFALQNQHWTLVGLDVAYTDHAIDDEQVDWLEKILVKADGRKVILFSHHQLYSHFEDQGTKLWRHPGFGQILRSKRIYAWYWGHEHRCCIFEEPDKNFGILGRCIGHGGMPQSRNRTRELPRATEAMYRRADWRRSPSRAIEGNTLPNALVLEGRNEYITSEEEKFLPHGYAVLNFSGPMLKEQVLDAMGNVIYEKTLAI